MKMTGMMGERNFFSQQPFWEVTKQRENSLLCMEDFNLRLMRYNVNQGHSGLDCIPGKFPKLQCTSPMPPGRREQ